MRFLARFTAVFFMACFGVAYADNYPNKPIKFVMPFSAGGSGDFVGRAIGAKLDEAWGQPVLIDNRPGAAGIIGAGAVAKSAPDGYTFLLSDESPLYIAPLVQKSRPFDPRTDFEPIILIAHIEFMLTVNPSVPANDLASFIAHLKKHPRKYSYASAGFGSIHHLSMEWLKRLAGIEMVHVPYKGSGQIMPDVISGQVAITYTGISQALPHVKSGRLQAIALGGPKRLSAAPGVAPVAETFPAFNGTTSWSLFAPAGTPLEIRKKVNAEINRILRMTDVAQQLTLRGLFPLGGSPEDLAASLETAGAKWDKLISELQLKE